MLEFSAELERVVAGPPVLEPRQRSVQLRPVALVDSRRDRPVEPVGACVAIALVLALSLVVAVIPPVTGANREDCRPAQERLVRERVDVVRILLVDQRV